jgi:PKD repeat protein
LYYVVFNGTNNSEIRRIRYTGQPVAIAEASPTNGPLPLAVDFSGDDSFDPAGQPLTYQWAFGDGATSNGANPSHTYTLTGTYTAVLTVTDTTSTTATDSVDIFAGNAAPIATIVTPTAGTTYDVDDVINFSGTGIDAEDGTLPGTSLQWEVKLHHHQHVHFDYHNATGLSGSFTAPDHGNDTAMEICLTVTDSGNLSDTECMDLLPNTVVYTFNTNPSGFQIVYEGASYTTPFTATPIVNSHQTIIAPQVQQHRSFSSWSDGGSSSHAITIAVTPQTYLATYVNIAPAAVIGATPISGPPPLIVTLSGSGSSDPEEDILTYLWNFGDGGTSTLTSPLHTYAFTGTYTAILTVTDELGLTSSSSRTINVGTNPLYLPIIVK